MLVIETTDSTANLAMIAGHPRYATRVREFKVAPHIQDLSGSGKYIGAVAVQGRLVYAHKVTRPDKILVVMSAAVMTVACAEGTAKGDTVATVTGAPTDSTFSYRVNPVTRAILGDDGTAAGYTVLESGTTQITAPVGAIIEVVALDEDSKVIAAGYAVSVPKR
jgi:hypothetical protein